MAEEKSVLQPVDRAAILQARDLVRTARHAALAVLDEGRGAPGVSRVGMATDIDGTPIVLVSGLAPHTAALRANPSCALLVGEVGKGDPLAHPRISISALAEEVPRDGAEHQRLRTRYLNHQPKAKLYADLGDFRFFRLEPVAASLNGGFGKAYAMQAEHLLLRTGVTPNLLGKEAAAVAHMNEDHAEAIEHYARYYLNAPAGRWVLTGIDEEGITIALGDEVRRIVFEANLTSADDMHMTLVRMARQARSQLETGGSLH